jgi:hypothetical protein
MKKFLLFAVVFFSGFSPIFGQQPANPTVTVSGNEVPYEVGSLVILKGSVVGEPPANLLKVSYFWLHVVNDFPVSDFITVQDDNSEIHVGTGKVTGKLNFVLIPVFEYRADKDVKVVYSPPIKIVVTVGDIQPPTPPSLPKPTLSDGKFKISQGIAENLIDDKNISNSDKVSLAKALSSALNDTLTTYKTNPVHQSFNSTYSTATSKIKLYLGLLKGVDISKTMVFENYLQTQIYGCYKDKGMNNTDDLMTCFSEVNVALDWVVKNLGETKNANK